MSDEYYNYDSGPAETGKDQSMTMVPEGSYFHIILQRYPALPRDVYDAVNLFADNHCSVEHALQRIAHCDGPYWRSVKLNVKRMPLRWDKAVKLLE